MAAWGVRPANETGRRERLPAPTPSGAVFGHKNAVLRWSVVGFSLLKLTADVAAARAWCTLRAWGQGGW